MCTRARFQKDPSILEGISKPIKKEVLEHKLPESLPDDSVHSKVSEVSTDSDSQNELGWNPPVVKERGVEYSYRHVPQVPLKANSDHFSKHYFHY